MTRHAAAKRGRAAAGQLPTADGTSERGLACVMGQQKEVGTSRPESPLNSGTCVWAA